MKLFRSLWALLDNDSMDITQIEASAELQQEPETEVTIEHTIQTSYDYSNIINLLDYINVKKRAY